MTFISRRLREEQESPKPGGDRLGLSAHCTQTVDSGVACGFACNALEKTFAEAKVKNCSGYFGFDAFAAELCALEARDEGGRPVARDIHKAVPLADIDAAQ